MITTQTITSNAVASVIAYLIQGRVDCYAVRNYVTGIETRYRMSVSDALDAMNAALDAANA